MVKYNILVAQGGGPTSVINQSVVGIISEAKKYSCFNKILGAMHGIRGIINEDFIDLTQETSNNLELIAKTPSSILGSTRDRPDMDYCLKILKVLKKYNINTFFYIGGNDSSGALSIIENEAKKQNYDLICIHIPKTIDNDIVLNDHTPGYASAARYLVNFYMGINLDIEALPGIYVGIVMGRNSGFLTGAAALAKKYPDDGPHLIYLPESTFNKEKFLLDIEETYKKYGRCVVALSEGIKDKDDNLLIEQISHEIIKDAHDNISMSDITNNLAIYIDTLIKSQLCPKLGNLRIRVESLGLIQRCYPESISNVDQREAREVGEKAVHYAYNDKKSGSVVIKRVGFYSTDYDLVKLKDVAYKTKFMPKNFVNDNENWVTQDFLMYLRPLLGSNLPEVFKLRKTKYTLN